MIVAMKKVYCICQSKDSLSTLAQLRSLGVVHVENQHLPQGKDISVIQEDIALVNSSLDIISSRCGQKKHEKPKQKTLADWKGACRHIVELDKRLDRLAEYSRQLKSRISQWQSWGDFDPEKINALAQRGVFIRFYQIPLKEIGALPKNFIVKQISVNGGIADCLVIFRDKPEIPYKEVSLPKSSLSSMFHKLKEDGIVENELREELSRNESFFNDIYAKKELLGRELEFQQVLAGMGESKDMVYLVGYVPFDASETLLKAAREKQWAISLQEPADEDNVPTLVRNPEWVNMIKPVLGLLGITPGYRELDVSMLFLVFFSVFFGILIGDAGYGMVYILLTMWMQRKMKNNAKAKDVCLLFYLLSSCAVIWGVLTGTFFGQEWLIRLGVKPLVPQLNEVKFMQTFCFFLGALHLSIAHSWRASIKFPSLTALADIGWICVLWSAFFLARTLILGAEFPFWGKWLISGGIGLVIFFTNPSSNLLKTVGHGLGTVALSLMNNFTDVVSYVRLFAVGLAGVAIAETANIMASSLGSGFMAWAASALIVVIGHGLNIILGPMSVLVHGVRLNVLEFSGHANVSWSGINYEPLRE
jgi:V/A-type H+-transporting ATPase subunit I